MLFFTIGWWLTDGACCLTEVSWQYALNCTQSCPGTLYSFHSVLI